MRSSEPIPSQLLNALHLTAADSIECLLERTAYLLAKSLEGSQCAIWWIDKTRNGLFMRFVHHNSHKAENFSDAFIPYDMADQAGLFHADHPSQLEPDSSIRSLQGCLFVRIHYDEQTNGLISVFRSGHYLWTEEERALLDQVGKSVAAGCCRLDHQQKTEQLLDILRKLGEATYEDPIVSSALELGKKLLGCDRAVLRRINLKTGELELRGASPRPKRPFTLASGEGITGLALRDKRVYRIDDVTAEKWRTIYRPLWSGSRAVLAVPILLSRARIRVGRKIDFAEKPFGVLNFESPAVAAFSKFDEDCAVLISQNMARVFERIEFDDKLAKLRKVERMIAERREMDPGVITDQVLDEIRKTLGFEYVSFSLVNSDLGVIRCSRVLGLENPAEFRKYAVHQLDGANIQADVVRSKRTEVPSEDDPRLDEDLSRRFGLGSLIRVFIPVLDSSRNEVLGTLSAGYNRKLRPHIYEPDIQVLRGFVDFASGALEARRRNVMARISHEINAPLAALRHNLSRLSRYHRPMSWEKLDQILHDLNTDATTLHYEVQLLEYIWAGRTATKRPLKVEPVLLFRELIFKTIQELKPMVRDNKLDPSHVTYEEGDVHKLGVVHVDKSKISQVIFNLFVNAIKYSESPETFQIRIGAEEQKDRYVIKFCDWGIGIPQGMEEKIFEEGFRAPSVVAQMKISGSGLGLTIAREIMREHGGDLVLRNRFKPTEFHILIPKRPPEAT